MRWIIGYLPIAVAIGLSVGYRNSYFARLVGAAILLCVSTLHLGYLIGAHRLIEEKVKLQASDGNYQVDPIALSDVLNAIQHSCHNQLPLFAALVCGWAILAILPFRPVMPTNQ